eukprot:54129-Eustigmatos_ZCMA.PRE.1
MTAHFVEPASSAEDGVRNFVSYDMETVMCEMPWPEGATARYIGPPNERVCTRAMLLLTPGVTTGGVPWGAGAAELMADFPGDHTVDMMTETLIDAMIESIMEDPTLHDATLRLHPVLVVAEKPPSFNLRFQFMYWEDEGESVVQ